jgi:excinuclease ABC subunit B
MPDFQLVTDFRPTGDQPEAIAKLIEGLRGGVKHQTLLGATGTGKTFVIANLVEALNRPTLVIAHNKTLAAQLYSEFKAFFPHNAVEYFVSYYDYYQPEAYVPQQDLYIEKDTLINEQIDRLRLAATAALLSRRDVLIVASVSCIYGLGRPDVWREAMLTLERGQTIRRDAILRHLVRIQYNRNDLELSHGTFRVRGDTLEIMSAYSDQTYRVTLWGDEIERIVEVDLLTGEVVAEHDEIVIAPAAQFMTRSGSGFSARTSFCSKPNGWSSVPSTTWRCCARSATAPVSRTTPATWTAVCPASHPLPWSTTSPPITCWSSTSRT